MRGGGDQDSKLMLMAPVYSWIARRCLTRVELEETDANKLTRIPVVHNRQVSAFDEATISLC